MKISCIYAYAYWICLKFEFSYSHSFISKFPRTTFLKLYINNNKIFLQTSNDVKMIASMLVILQLKHHDNCRRTLNWRRKITFISHLKKKTTKMHYSNARSRIEIRNLAVILNKKWMYYFLARLIKINMFCRLTNYNFDRRNEWLDKCYFLNNYPHVFASNPSAYSFPRNVFLLQFPDFTH